MIRKMATLMALIIAAVALGGCRTAPILNITNAAIARPDGKELTYDQVKSAIIRAGSVLGWQMKEEGQGSMTGTLVLRAHTAIVNIKYSPSAYSIIYQSSTNLDASGGNIHKNYNSWVQNLSKGINTQLNLL